MCVWEDAATATARPGVVVATFRTFNSDCTGTSRRLRLARAAAACISADWSEHPFRCHMLEVAWLQ